MPTRFSARSSAPTPIVRTRNACESIGAIVPLPDDGPPISLREVEWRWRRRTRWRWMWRCRWRCRWRRTRAWPQRWRQWTAPDLHGRQRGRLGQLVDELLHRCAPVRGRGILEGLPGALLGRAHVAAEVEVALRGGRLLGVEGLEVLLSHVLLSHVQSLLLVRQRGSDGEDVITRARVVSRQVAAAERGRREEGMRPKAQGQGERHLCGRFRAKRLIGLRR